DVRGHSTPPEHHEAAQEHEGRAAHGKLRDHLGAHRRRNDAVTARRARMKEALRSSGTRKRRSLAMCVSTSAITPPSASSLRAKVPAAHSRAPGVITEATPHGAKRLPRREKKTRSLRAAAHSMRARER